MPAAYPNSIFDPRPVENREGVVYNPANLTTIYAEDIHAITDEIVAVESDLEQLITYEGARPVITDTNIRMFSELPYEMARSKELAVLRNLLPLELPYNGYSVADMQILGANLWWVSAGGSPAVAHHLNLFTGHYVEIELPAGTYYPKAVMVGDHYFYILCNSSPFRLIRVDIFTDTVVNYIDGGIGQDFGVDLCTAEGKIVVVTNTSPARILIVDQELTEVSDEHILPTGYNSAVTIDYMYNRYYITLNTTPARVVAINRGIYTIAAEYNAVSGVEDVKGATTDGTYFYFCTKDPDGNIFKLRVVDLTLADETFFGSGAEYVTTLAFDGDTLLLGTGGIYARMLRYSTDDLQEIANYFISYIDGDMTVVSASVYGYFMLGGDTGRFGAFGFPGDLGLSI